jgi:LysM repeat protein
MLPQTAQTAGLRIKSLTITGSDRPAERLTRGTGRRHGNYLGSSVDSANSHRRPRKIRRTGRHTQPSQVEKVAEVATKAAPAVAIAGALVATAPQAQAAVSLSAKTTTVAEQVHTDALVQHSQPATRTYTVRSGDTLSSIAQRFYGNSADWAWLYHVNSSVVHDPNSIYVGEVLKIPADPPANAAHYAPKHAKHAKTSTTATLTSSATKLSGKLSCSGLEALWEAAGGSHGEAFMAAEIAEAESGGNQYALSPTNDYGYWQINGSHGPAMATFNPMGNAKAAIAISDDGRDWGAWTTYTSGAYAGRC